MGRLKTQKILKFMLGQFFTRLLVDKKLYQKKFLENGTAFSDGLIVKQK